MNSKNELKVAVNFADRVCTISDTNGTVLLSTPIKKEDYNKASIVERLGKLRDVMVYSPEAKLPNADLIVYEALKEYDDTNKTNYSREYLKIVIDKIQYQSPDRDEPMLEKILRQITGRRLESEANYLERARKIKSEQLSEHGLSITYSDIETIQESSELGSAEKSVAIAIVKRQQGHNGIETGKLDKVPLIQEEVKAEPPVQPKVEEQPIVIEQPVQPEKPVKSEKTDKPEQTGKAKEEQKAKPKTEPKAPKPKNKKKKIEGIKANREAYRQRLQAGNPKKYVKQEGASAQKRETKQERKARLAREAMQQRRAENAQKASKAKQTPTQQPKSNSSKKPVVKSVKAGKEPIQVRFTRKLKNAADSIRNKIHKPRKELLNICGCVAIAGLVLLAGIKGYQHLNSDNSSNMISETMSAVQIVDEVGENQDNEQTIEPSVESGSEVDTSINIPSVSIVEDEDPSGSSDTRTDDEQTIVTDSQATLDNQIGNIMVDEGKYFSSPDGTGNYGYFENYQDCKKEMTIIGLATDSGYTKIGSKLEVKDEEGNVQRYIQIKTSDGDVIVDANDIELAESIIRQNYPNANYMAVHFEAEHEDGERTTLGWVRSDISEKSVDNTRTQTQMEDLER